MNTKDNKRKQNTIHTIESVFLQLLQKKELNQITVSLICKESDINRSTFYSHYLDVYDLADKLRDKLEAQVAEIYHEEGESLTNSHNFLKLFKNIYENQIFYSAYFKLGYDSQIRVLSYDMEMAKKRFGNRFVDYHIEFFMQGLNAVIKKWLAGGCKETPENMMEILNSEYKGIADL